MSVRILNYLTLPSPMEVEGRHIAFARDADGSVEVEVSYPDDSWATRGHRSEMYVTISREDWDAIVAHVAALPGEEVS